MVRLDRHRRPAGERHALDHVGIERALRQKFGAADLLRLGLEHVDEQLADDLALGLRIADARERGEEMIGGVDVHQRNVVVAAEQLDDLLGFVEPQQAVVDEHAGELLADRLVDQHRGDRGIDAARQAADHPALADLRADFLDRLVLEGAHGPVAAAARDLAHEIADQRRALRRVHHLEMKLRGVELARLVGDHGDRRVRRRADHAEARGQHGDAVAVAHPHRIVLALAPHALEQRRVLGDQNLGAAEFAVMAGLDLAAELRRHRLLAVADAEHRNAGLHRSPAAPAARPRRAPRPARRTGSRPSASSAGTPPRPSGTARSRNRPSPRARGAR